MNTLSKVEIYNRGIKQETIYLTWEQWEKVNYIDFVDLTPAFDDEWKENCYNYKKLMQIVKES